VQGLSNEISGVSVKETPVAAVAVAAASFILLLFAVYFWRHHKATSQRNLKNQMWRKALRWPHSSGSGPAVSTPERSGLAEHTNISFEHFMGDFESNASENRSIVSLDNVFEDIRIHEMYKDKESDPPNLFVLDDFRAAKVPSEQEEHQSNPLSVSMDNLY